MRELLDPWISLAVTSRCFSAARSQVPPPRTVSAPGRHVLGIPTPTERGGPSDRGPGVRLVDCCSRAMVDLHEAMDTTQADSGSRVDRFEIRVALRVVKETACPVGKTIFFEHQTASRGQEPMACTRGKRGTPNRWVVFHLPCEFSPGE